MRSLGLRLGLVAFGFLYAATVLSGCSEPTGDAAYSQQFEKPASAAGPDVKGAPSQNPYELRNREKDE